MNETDGETTRSKWQENHGNVLAIFLGLVLVLGAALVVYRQNRAHKAHSPPDVRPRVYDPAPVTPENAGSPGDAGSAPSSADPSGPDGDPVTQMPLDGEAPVDSEAPAGSASESNPEPATASPIEDDT